MKKVLLCGATHGSNFGDSLFAIMFNKKIEKKFDDVDVYFTKASEYSKEALNIKVAGLKELFSMDGMVYISGGYFGQSHNENLKGSIYRFLTYFAYGLFMILRRKPIAIIGVGAGPLERKFLRKTAKYIFNKAKIVSVRDKESRDYMRNYGVQSEIRVTSDSAQVINDAIFNIKKENTWISSQEKLKNRQKVLIHLASKNSDLYNDIVIGAILDSLGSRKDIGFIITTDYVTKGDELREVYKLFPSEQTVIYDFNNPLEFVEVISNVDAVITPKLHVGIIATTFHKSVISFPLHPGKTIRYYQQIGYPERCKSLFDVSKEESKEMILSYIDSKVNLSQNLLYKANENFDLLLDFLENNVRR
ncbi:polysaccharide pyruvyl transferase WcaK-like protein [Gracilibacillus halotolerans]|uniref:Polysaccharide pyruvyl transferase WcaK-like protein n=1 Tax=Gracilibacillus halotolerans TaxID=74386 RepID=A0A841RJJ5_9BACI|nr:polysaccharide pyruvyl transferase family protein [Gracilibacillus halotolerans]MBB6512861.1 polysaccharide pyruvyl transferase WcaK-like protein [Gracilibacillus halotolerans]